MLSKRVDHGSGQWDRPLRRPRLRRQQAQLSINTLQRVSDRKYATGQVDVLPTQADQLGSTKTQVNGDHVQGMHPVSLRRREKETRPVDGQTKSDFVLRRRDPNQLRHVA